MTVVHNIAHDAAGQPVKGKTVTIKAAAPFFVTGDQSEVLAGAYPKTDSTGLWTADLVATPDGWYYTVREPHATWTFTVPATGGPYWLESLLVDSPATPPPVIGSVRYDGPQSLTSGQKTQALANIGADAAGAAAAAQTAAVASADSYTDGAVTAEAVTRASADTALAASVTSEASTRAMADTTNATAITAEATARASAVTAEATARASADTTLTTNLATEVTRATAAEATKEATANKGAASGYAPLDGSSLLPLANVPALPESRITGLTADLAALVTADSTEASARASADTTLTTAVAAKVAKGSLVFDVRDYGAVGDGVTDDTAAIQAAITAATSTQGIVWIPPLTFAYGGLTLPKGVSLVGSHIPSADATTLATGSTLLRTTNNVGISIRGTDRTTNRIGANRIAGIRFLETANVSALSTLDCKYADSLVLEDLTFWQASSTTTIGHAVAAEECWDWRIRNVIQKGCGKASSSKYGFYLYNGAVNSCNDWDFIHLRCQESGGTSVYFDSTGAGSRNTLFDFTACKFEDARGVSATATIHVDGNASNVTFHQTEFGGAITNHCNVASPATQWVWDGCLFSGLTSGAAASLVLGGGSCKVIASHFNSMTLTQLMNITGGNNAVIGCTQSGTAAPFNSGMPITTLVLSPQLGFVSIGGTPSTDKALVVGLPTSGATSQYGVLANPTFGSDGTSSAQAVATQPKTAAAAYTVSSVYGVRALDASKGSGSTITTQVGVQVDNQTQGANNFAIRTGTGPVSLGDVLELTAAATARGSGKVGLGSTTQTTVGATGAASALPANPLGYLIAYVAGTKVAIPYYTA